MNTLTAIRTMNEYGRKSVPFLFVVDFEQLNPIVLPVEQANSHGLFFEINGFRNFDFTDSLPSTIIFEKNPISFQRYLQAFQLVQQHLHFGNSFLVNLTFPTEITTNLSLRQIFLHSQAPYKLLFQDYFVLFSPEIFVRIRNGTVMTFPMKGTIDADLPNAESQILGNEKEKAEHATIVDLLRNDLSQIAKSVKVRKFRYTDHIKTNQKNLLQVSSEIAGILPPDYPSRIGEILFRLLPAGSVSGAPKTKTLQIIREAEGAPRGFYTGIFGYFDGKNLDSGVMIRFIEQREGKRWFRSGGGITAQSNCQTEYEELINKVYVPII